LAAITSVTLFNNCKRPRARGMFKSSMISLPVFERHHEQGWRGASGP
jgi:hypothetical protein